MSKHPKTTTTTTTPTSSNSNNNNNMPQIPGSLEMSRLPANERKKQAAIKQADDSLADIIDDVTDEVVDSEADTLSFEQDCAGRNNTTTTTTTTSTNRRCDTEDDEEEDDDDETITRATRVVTTSAGDEDYYYYYDEDDRSCGDDVVTKKRKRKQRKGSKRAGDDTLLITTRSDKKSMQHEQQLRNGQFFQAGVSNSAASVNKMEDDCWSKDLERDTPSPNLDESKKNWETRCIVVVVVIVACIVAAIFVFFLTGQSKGEHTIDFRFANYLSSHMILQASPHKAVVWGYGPKPSRDEEIAVHVRIYRSSYVVTSSDRKSSKMPTSEDAEPTISPSFEYQTKVLITAAGNTWKAVVGPVSEPGPFRITASVVYNGVEHVISMEDVLFGDVWLCSGHDNLYDNVNKLINITDEELSSSSSSSLFSSSSSSSTPTSSGGGGDDNDLRIFSVFPAKSDIPWFDVHVVDINWSVATRSFLPWIRDRGGHSTPRYPSACFMFGQRLRQTFGRPVGLVAATYGDSSIEEWSPAGVIDACSLEYPDSSSRIWNGMIHPLLEMQVKGIIWQQEGNFYGENMPVNYSCSMKEFLNQWRTWMGKRTTTGGKNQSYDVSLMPIGIIQMPPSNSSQYDWQTAQLRWMTTDGYGVLPNNYSKNIFIVVTVDLPNPEDIRQKRIIADRLFRGSSHLAYQKTKVEFQGPIPIKYVAKSQKSLTLTFDTNIEVRNNEGFEICCSKTRNLTCKGESSGNFWGDSLLISTSDSTLTLSGEDCPWHIVGFRYAWKDTPCSLLECSVYSRQTGLPMPPYIRLGLVDNGYVRDLGSDPVPL